MTIHRKPKTGNFSIVDNGFTKDPLLDWDAKGMLTYLLSKPDNWTPNKTDLIKAVDSSGEVKVESILKKLEVAGYLIRWQSRDAKGKIFYGAEILECFKDREEVLNALLERKATDKYFKISVGRFYRSGENENGKLLDAQTPLVARKKQNQGLNEPNLTVAVLSVGGESAGGKLPHILNTELIKTELIKTDKEIKEPLPSGAFSFSENNSSKDPSVSELAALRSDTVESFALKAPKTELATLQPSPLSTSDLTFQDTSPPRNENENHYHGNVAQFEAAFKNRTQHPRHTTPEAKALVKMGLAHLWVGPERNDYAPELIEAVRAKKKEWKQPFADADVFNYIRNRIREFNSGSFGDATLLDLYNYGVEILRRGKPTEQKSGEPGLAPDWHLSELRQLNDLREKSSQKPALLKLIDHKIFLLNENPSEYRKQYA